MAASGVYPFRHPTPFEMAQRYDFADCAADAFFAGWRAYRQMLRAAIRQKKQALVCEVPSLYGAQPLKDLLGDPETFWLLIRKFEVFGRLFSHYDSSGRKHENAIPATLSDYIDFGLALAQRAERERCLQYLSTLLKLIDAIAEQVMRSDSAAYDPEKIVQLLDCEERLIERLLS
jgi:hypothetical protein